MTEDKAEVVSTVVDPTSSLKINLEDPATAEAIAQVAVQISLRYRNGFTLVGISGEDGEAYLKYLSAALTACKCKHMPTMLEVRVVAIGGKPTTVVINNPSPHLFKKKPTVLAVPDITSDTGYFGTWLMAKGVKKLEVSTFRCVGPVPKWLNPAYIAFLEEPAPEVAPEALALPDMPQAQSL